MSWEANYNIVSPEKGDVMDLVGEPKRTNIKVDSSNHWIDESFEIKVRNRKQDETIEFRVALKPGEERTLTYTVHYSW
jgi:hypothetical protein